MNVARLIKLKMIGSEFDEFNEKEKFLLNYFNDLEVVCEVFPTQPNTGKTSYYLIFTDKICDIVFSSDSNRMFEYIIPHIFYEFDMKFYNSKLCEIDSQYENDIFAYYYDSDIYHEVAKIYSTLDKKLKISKNVFNHYGFGH